MVRSLLKWLRLPGADRWRTARLAWTLLWLKAFPRSTSIGTAHPRDAADPPNHPGTAVSEAELRVARAYATAVERASNGLPFSTTCLERSVALRRALRKRSIPAELKIGVRRGDRSLEAHAWVEVSGVILNDSEDVHQRYSAFDEAVLPSHFEIRGP